MSQIYLTFQILLISLAQDFSFQSGHLGRQLSYFDRFNRPGLDSGLFFTAIKPLAYCHTCVKGFKEKKMKAAKADAAFVSVYVVR